MRPRGWRTSCARLRRRLETDFATSLHLGQRHVDDKVVAILRRQLNDADKSQLLKDLKYAPAWVAIILQRLAAKTP